VRLSNLTAHPGTSASPLADPGVQVSELGSRGPTADDDSINLSELLRALRRRRKLVALTAGTVVVLAALITGYQRLFRPVYEGGFQLLISDPISDENKGPASGADTLNNTMFAELARNTTSSDIPTLIELLKSPVMLDPIAHRFGTTSSALADQITIATGGSRQEKAEGVLTVKVIGRDPQKDKRLLDELSQTYLQSALNQRQQRLADGIRFLNQQAPALEYRTAELQAELASFRQRHSLLEPTAEGGALKIQISTFEDQLASLQAERGRLQSVRQGILAGNLTARSFEEVIGTGPRNSGGGVNQGLSVTGTNQILMQELTKMEQQLAETRSRFSPSSAMVRGLTARRNALLPLLRSNQLEAVDAALSLNANRLATAQRQLAQLGGRFQQQPALIKQYEALQQKLQIAQENLAGFIKTRENFQLEIAQRTVPWKVIAPPEINPNPVKPSVPRNLAVGVVLGLVAGAGAGLLRDRLDHVFHSPMEVKDDLGEPLLGHIPHVAFFKGVREDRRFLLQELDASVRPTAGAGGDGSADDAARLSGYQRFFYQEALRNLFTSLRFLNSDRPLRSVALTSSLPAEGKSLTNVLLAKTIAEMGQRVLLVDADLRKPQMHHRLGVNNLTGLSNLLTEGSLDWRQAIQKVKGYEGWTVLTAGRRPPDPTRLLSSARMRQLVNDLASSGDFDLILYDTPPVLGLADAALVAEHIDGLMLVVSLGRVDRGLPKEAIARIRSAGAQLLGVVTNAIKEDGDTNTAYGYGNRYKYGYGYGYGYGGYDTRSAYSYYGEPDADPDANTAAASPSAEEPAPRAWSGQARQLRRRFLHWIDS